MDTKPVKLTNLIPMLPVRSMPVSVEYYQKALGFSVQERNDEWGWAMLRLGDCRLMVDQSLNAFPEAPRQSIIYLYPEDIDKYHSQVRQTGLQIPDLRVTFYGNKEFRIVDPDGNGFWIGQPIS